MNPKNKTKIALVKPAHETLDMWYSWCDGLYGAFNELANDFNVSVFGYSDQPSLLERGNLKIHLSNYTSSLRYWLNSFNPQIIFGWGTAYHNWDEIQEDAYLNGVKKKILLFGGGGYDYDNAKQIFDTIVVENPSDAKYFGDCPVAFGTNTDVFKPMELNKLYPAFFPAAFANWKRHYLFANAMPAGSLCVGHMQPHEKDCFETCVDKGHIVMPTLPMTSMPYMYNQSLGVCLTAEHIGGCQRAALEAMACNVPVLTTNDGKAAEFNGVWACPPEINEIREAYAQMVMAFENNKIDLREEYIIGKYDHKTYAKKLEELI